MKTPNQSDKHTPGYIITPSSNQSYAHLICLPNGKALAAIFDQGSVDGKPELELAESFVRAVNSHDDMLAALQKISANAAESPEWIRRVAQEAIAKAEGLK